jgi:lysophospholipase L1-like esterase
MTIGSDPSGASGGRIGLGAIAGLGLLAGVSSALLTLFGQAKSTTRHIEAAGVEAFLADGTLVPPALPGGSRAQQRLADHLQHIRLPQGEGTYTADGARLADDATDQPGLTLVMLGDSTSVGYGTRTPEELPGVLLARGIAAHAGRPVRLVSHGLTGARTSDLARQVELCLAAPPDLVVILVGANDLRDMVPPRRSAAQLGAAVHDLVAAGIPVVVGTCPDFGVITAIPQPLRTVLSTWSLRLAALQERAVLASGGASVPLARLVSPQFVGNPQMFAGDHFHPSGAGYERAMAAVLPAALEQLADGPDNTRPGPATERIGAGPGPGVVS